MILAKINNIDMYRLESVMEFLKIDNTSDRFNNRYLYYVVTGKTYTPRLFIPRV